MKLLQAAKKPPSTSKVFSRRPSLLLPERRRPEPWRKVVLDEETALVQEVKQPSTLDLKIVTSIGRDQYQYTMYVQITCIRA